MGLLRKLEHLLEGEHKRHHTKHHTKKRHHKRTARTKAGRFKKR